MVAFLTASLFSADLQENQKKVWIHVPQSGDLSVWAPWRKRSKATMKYHQPSANAKWETGKTTCEVSPVSTSETAHICLLEVAHQLLLSFLGFSESFTLASYTVSFYNSSSNILVPCKNDIAPFFLSSLYMLARVGIIPFSKGFQLNSQSSSL